MHSISRAFLALFFLITPAFSTPKPDEVEICESNLLSIEIPTGQYSYIEYITRSSDISKCNPRIIYGIEAEPKEKAQTIGRCRIYRTSSASLVYEPPYFGAYPNTRVFDPKEWEPITLPSEGGNTVIQNTNFVERWVTGEGWVEFRIRRVIFREQRALNHPLPQSLCPLS